MLIDRRSQWATASLVVWAVAIAIVSVGSGWADDSAEAQVLVGSARDELKAGHISSARDKLWQAHRLRPRWLVPHQWLALIYQAEGDEQAATGQYAAVQRYSLAQSSDSNQNAPEGKQAVLDCEALTMWLVNQSRQQHRQRLLLPDPRLSEISRQHSVEMRDLGYFSHTSPVEEKQTVSNRFESLFGFRPDCIGENIGRRWGTGSDYLTAEKVTQTHRRFMRKPTHRRVILYPKFDRIGVGIAVNEDGHYWLTEVLAAYPTVVAKTTLAESAGGD